MDGGDNGVEATGGRSVLICLSEAREMLARACRGAVEMVEVRTADGRRAFVAEVAEADARRFLSEPGARGWVLQGA